MLTRVSFLGFLHLKDALLPVIGKCEFVWSEKFFDETAVPLVQPCLRWLALLNTMTREWIGVNKVISFSAPVATSHIILVLPY